MSFPCARASGLVFTMDNTESNTVDAVFLRDSTLTSGSPQAVVSTLKGDIFAHGCSLILAWQEKNHCWRSVFFSRFSAGRTHWDTHPLEDRIHIFLERDHLRIGPLSIADLKALEESLPKPFPSF